MPAMKFAKSLVGAFMDIAPAASVATRSSLFAGIRQPNLSGLTVHFIFIGIHERYWGIAIEFSIITVFYPLVTGVLWSYANLQ